MAPPKIGMYDKCRKTTYDIRQIGAFQGAAWLLLSPFAGAFL